MSIWQKRYQLEEAAMGVGIALLSSGMVAFALGTLLCLLRERPRFIELGIGLCLLFFVVSAIPFGWVFYSRRVTGRTS